MKKLNTNLLLPGILLILSSGCGFHLRGHSSATTYKFPFKTVYIDCSNVVICANLSAMITTQMLAKIESSPESAAATIKLVKEETSRDAQNFTSVGRVSAYVLTYTVTAQIIQDHEPDPNDIVVSSQAVMQYNDSTILSSNQNEVVFWEQLHDSVTNQLVKRIAFSRQYNTNTHDKP